MTTTPITVASDSANTGWTVVASPSTVTAAIGGTTSDGDTSYVKTSTGGARALVNILPLYPGRAILASGGTPIAGDNPLSQIDIQVWARCAADGVNATLAVGVVRGSEERWAGTAVVSGTTYRPYTLTLQASPFGGALPPLSPGNVIYDPYPTPWQWTLTAVSGAVGGEVRVSLLYGVATVAGESPTVVTATDAAHGTESVTVGSGLIVTDSGHGSDGTSFGGTLVLAADGGRGDDSATKGQVVFYGAQWAGGSAPDAYSGGRPME